MSRFDEEPDGDPHGECALEIVRLQSERDQYYKCFLAEQTEHAKAIAARDNAERELASLRAEKERAEAERDAALKDAGRYRWLRETQAYVAVRPQHIQLPLVDRTGWTIRLVSGNDENFDAAIDAAIAARKGEQ